MTEQEIVGIVDRYEGMGWEISVISDDVTEVIAIKDGNEYMFRFEFKSGAASMKLYDLDGFEYDPILDPLPSGDRCKDSKTSKAAYSSSIEALDKLFSQMNKKNRHLFSI